VTAIVMAVAAAAGVAAAAVVVAEEMANAKQTVEAEAKTQQSTIKKQKNGSEDEGRSGVAAVSGGRQHVGVDVGGGGAHPSNNQKDDDESSGRGGTRHYRGDCDDVVGYRRRTLSRGCDQDYDDDGDNAGHTTLSGQRDRGTATLLPTLLPLLSAGGTVPLICAHP
jgi:hypothetical protein